MDFLGMILPQSLDPLHVDVALPPRGSPRAAEGRGRLPPRAHGQVEEPGILLGLFWELRPNQRGNSKIHITV